MKQQTQLHHGDEISALEKIPVESFPVTADKKLSLVTPFSKLDYALCPHCFKTATGLDSVIKEFGLRTMGDGVIRVQSWCKDCRNKSQKVTVKW